MRFSRSLRKTIAAYLAFTTLTIPIAGCDFLDGGLDEPIARTRTRRVLVVGFLVFLLLGGAGGFFLFPFFDLRQCVGEPVYCRREPVYCFVFHHAPLLGLGSLHGARILASDSSQTNFV